MFSGRRHLVLEYCSLGSLQTILPRLKVEDKTSEFLPEMVMKKNIKNISESTSEFRLTANTRFVSSIW